MENHKDDIGELFGKMFENHQAVPEKDEWEMLNASLQDRNFFHFNAKQFNVYYASTIVFCFFVCLGVGTHYTYENFFQPQFQQTSSLAAEQNELVNPSEVKPNQSQTTINSEPKTVRKEKDASTNELEIQSEKSENQLVNTVKIETNKKDSIPQKISNGVHKFPSRGDNLSEAQIRGGDSSKAKPKRTLYITKQDTIVKFDTLHAPKQKKKWFK